MVSSPPRPLACSVSLEPMSIENGTRFVRSNLIRAPFGWTVNTSPAGGAVDLDIVAAIVAVDDVGAVAVVPDQRVVAGAAVHRVGSAVADDAVVAAAAVEDVVALTAEDQVRPVGAVDGVVAHAAVDGEQRARTHAVGCGERVVAAQAVDLEALGGAVDREGDQVRALELDAARNDPASMVNVSPRVALPLTSVASLPAPPSFTSVASPLFHTSVSLPASPFSVSLPFAPMRRSLPSPPLSVSLLSAPVSTSSPPPPLSCTPAISVFFASTVIASLPPPPLTDDGECAVGRHGLVAGGRAVPVGAVGQPAGRLTVNQQPAGHRHRHVVVRVVEVQRRCGSVERGRGGRRVGGTGRCAERCGQRRAAQHSQDGLAFHVESSQSRCVYKGGPRDASVPFAPWRLAAP